MEASRSGALVTNAQLQLSRHRIHAQNDTFGGRQIDDDRACGLIAAHIAGTVDCVNANSESIRRSGRHLPHELARVADVLCDWLPFAVGVIGNGNRDRLRPQGFYLWPTT